MNKHKCKKHPESTQFLLLCDGKYVYCFHCIAEGLSPILESLGINDLNKEQNEKENEL